MGIISGIMKERECGDCTLCCEGWLKGNIFGNKFGGGVPCKFVKKGQGCGIYEDRPIDPCITFKCYYQQDVNVPEKFRPSLTGNIMALRFIEGISYLDVTEADKSLDPELLDWVLEQYKDGKINNIRYFINGYPNWVTRDLRFDAAMRKLHRNIIPIKLVNYHDGYVSSIKPIN
jgi:hypothetical protein